MKKRFLITVFVISILISALLAACGEDKSGEATPDMAESTIAATASSAAAASSKPASSEAASSKVSSSPAQETSPGAVVHEAEQDNAPQEQPQQADPEAQPKSPSGDTASTGNPAYQDGAKPVYTIALTDTADKSKSYSAACNYATDKEDVAFVSFFLPGGEYDIAVYGYADDGDRGDPIATAVYKNPIQEDERRSIHVNYYPDSGKIEVEEVKSNRNQ